MSLEELFFTTFKMSVIASFVTLTLLLIRLLLRRAPKKYSYVLWAIVGVNLMPFLSFDNPVSVVPNNQTWAPQTFGYTFLPENTVPIITTMPVTGHYISDPARQTYQLVMYDILPLLWVVGIAVFIIYALLSYVRLKTRLATAVRVRDNIYTSDRIQSPFLLGVISPKIMLPTTLSPDEFDYIVLHEQTHMKRLDHWIKPLAFFIVVLHWFNPFVWLSYRLMVKDMEMSCDERVLKQATKDIRAGYSTSLLQLAMKQSSLFGPLSFGENNVKSRIQNVLRYQKPKVWLVSLTLTIVIVATATLMGNQQETAVDVALVNIEQALIVMETSEYITVQEEQQRRTIEPSAALMDHFHARQWKEVASVNTDFFRHLAFTIFDGYTVVLSSDGNGAKISCNACDEKIRYYSVPEGVYEELRHYVSTSEQSQNVNNSSDPATLPDFIYEGNDPVLQLVYTIETVKYTHRQSGFTVVAPIIVAQYEEGDRLKLFVTTYSSTYSIVNQSVEQGQAAIVPVAITLRKIKGTYRLVDYRPAQDGSNYAPSIRSFCTMPKSGNEIPKLAERMIASTVGDSNDKLQRLQRANLVQHLNKHGLSSVSLNLK